MARIIPPVQTGPGRQAARALVPAPWKLNEAAFAYLVTFDIAGFTRDPTSNVLLTHRNNFFQAVQNTILFPDADSRGQVKSHFLGDELRLAFRDTEAADVLTFASDVVRGASIFVAERTAGHTRLRSVVLAGLVTPRLFLANDFLNGELPFKAQQWMKKLKGGYIAMDDDFRGALGLNNAPPGWTSRKFAAEQGWVRKEV